ncbi:unnamed protein product [Rhodiola kirilowii]
MRGRDTCMPFKQLSKMVYMGHRRFLPRYHPYRQKKAAFNGETEHGIEPIPASGAEILQKYRILQIDSGNHIRPPKVLHGRSGRFFLISLIAILLTSDTVLM